MYSEYLQSIYSFCYDYKLQLWSKVKFPFEFLFFVLEVSLNLVFLDTIRIVVHDYVVVNVFELYGWIWL